MFKKLIVAALFFAAAFGTIRAQGNIEIYGYTQAYYNSFHNTWKQGAPEGEANYYFHNLGISQANVFLAKDLGDDFSAFVNFEFINNYSSDKGFGSFNLQEAYLKWDYRDFLKVKFGMLLPQFNNLLEIYNRTPLLPYLIRPKLYEANIGNMVNIFDILPQKALLQVNGSVPVESANFEYAVFLGGPPNSFISSPSHDFLPSYVSYGQSSTNSFSWGGRLGIRAGGLRLGVSTSFDVMNGNGFAKDENGGTADLGKLNRYRIGSDLSFKFGDFELSAEYLKVKTPLTSAWQDSLNTWNSLDPHFIGKDFDKTFYYASLQYNITESLYSYVMYDYLNDNVDPFYFGLDGFYGFHLGAGYYINDSIILKAQFIRNFARFDTGEEVDAIRDYSENNYAAGVSITF